MAGKRGLIMGLANDKSIAWGIAKALAAEGAQVTITGRRAEVLEQVAGDGLHAMAMDVRDESDIVAKIDAAVQARGPIQICVANAGVAEGHSIQKTSLEFWRNMMATNLDGAFLTIRESLKSMQTTDWGRIITVASVAGLRGMKGGACYSASKHGMVGLTKSVAEDLLGTGFTANAICPAYVDTAIITNNVKTISARAKVSEAEAEAMMVSLNRHKRLIAPEEVAAAALWLVRPGAESVNGQTIDIAGGQI